MMYIQTHDQRYLEQAINIAKFIMNHPHMPKDKIPYWDFDAPDISNAHRDTSAGAIMASCRYTTKFGENYNFILRHSTRNFPAGHEVDGPLSYTDYYYVEALIRYKNLLEGKPVVETVTAVTENQDRAIPYSSEPP